MILNNYYNAAANLANITPIFSDSRTSNIGVMQATNPPAPLLVTTGWSSGFPSVLPTMVQNWNPRSRLSVVIGSGTTEPTPEDVELENDITAEIANFAFTLQTSADGAAIKTVATITGTNTTGTAITIAEIGIQKAFETASSGTDPVPAYALMVRHLLDTQKTVANGESFSLTFEWAES